MKIMFGRIIDFEQKNQKILIKFEQGSGQVEVITDNIINIFSGLETGEHLSKAITEDKRRDTPVAVTKNSDHILIQTEELYIEVFDDFKVDFYNQKKELICRDYREGRTIIDYENEKSSALAALEGHTGGIKAGGHKIQIIKAMEGDEAFYGLGDKTGFLNKRGYEYQMWNSDLPQPQVDSFQALYKSIPFFITRRRNHVFGIFFDNHYRTSFNMGKESEEYYFFGAEEGNLDYYFIAGEAMPEIIQGYTWLTGTTPLPQLWTLGYHQSRWSYGSREEVLDIAAHFRALDIPCDGIHLDIDYMEAYKVFTWNEENFPNAEGMIADLNRDGFKIVTIIDPGVKVEKDYFVYEEGMKQGYFARDAKGNVYENVVWPGAAVFPDFSDKRVRSWWGDLQKHLLEKGVRGVWNDMNEPASFQGELPDDVMFSDEGLGANHRKMHNVYGHLMARATYEGLKEQDKRRPFVITRACYSGSQKYTTGWTGDNHSIWAHLQMAVPQLCNLGMSGLSFVGTDVGGFSSDCTPELLSRWVQIGCFSPLFRNHCCTGCRSQEPWAFDQETLEINKSYIKLRYRLLPYLYDLFWEGQGNGMPVIRPLVLHYEKDDRVKEINDQFMFGNHIMVAPVVVQGQRARSVYLPEGIWTDYWTKETLSGGRYILREVPLNVCPIYVKAGSIVPNYPPIQYVGEKEIVELTLDLYEGSGEYHHFQDNGEDFAYQAGYYNEYLFQMKEYQQQEEQENCFSCRELVIKMIHFGYESRYTSFLILYQGKEFRIAFQGEEIRIDLNQEGLIRS